MERIESMVRTWHKATFKNATEKVYIDKLIEEMEELTICLKDMDYYKQHAPLEAADVAICLINFLDKIYGKSLSEVITEKLEICKYRTWGEEDEEGNRLKITG